MRIIQRITNLANRAVGKIKEAQQPKVIPKYDEKRIEREVNYAHRVHRANPRLKALEERRLKLQKRRSL